VKALCDPFLKEEYMANKELYRHHHHNVQKRGLGVLRGNITEE
jgi:hypothetical protein